MKKKTNLKFLYWLLPLLLFFLAALYTFNSLNQIRYEELEESVVNPFWVQNGFVQNGASANLGWHFLLVFVYKIFGFSLFTAKFVRLGLYLISMFCLASVLKKYFGEKKAILPLLTIGLSPTLLYFNSQQTVYGIDLLYAPIVFYFADRLDFKKKSGNLIYASLTWFSAMVAWLSYPSFIFFLPALFGFYLYKLRQAGNRKSHYLLRNLAIGLFFFLLPLVSAFLYISNRKLLIYDEIARSGIFRGAGFFDFNLGLFAQNLKLNLTNFFIKPFGYYFEIKQVEFSLLFPVVALLFVFFALYKLWRSKKSLRVPIALALSILIFNLLVADFTIDPTPGMRRQTGTLAAIYFFFVFAAYWVTTISPKRLRILYLAPLSLLVLHHLFVYPVNLSHLKDPSRYREQVWFKTLDNPGNLLDGYVTTARKEEVKLICFDNAGKPLNCRYSELYAAVSASCFWNRLQCKEILGWDTKTGKFIPLSIEIFNNYYFGLYGKEIIAT